MDDDPDFFDLTSSASCHVDDIIGFHYGGSNARFWMLRKHFNTMTVDELKYAPFYSWQCITLELKHREVDLVIPNEKDMERFIKFLIHNLRCMDGCRGSADKLLELMQKEGEEAYMKGENKNFISDSVKAKIKQSNEHKVFSKVYFKYLMLKIRAKISFLAFQKRMTIAELFTATIINCYEHLMQVGAIPKLSESDRKRHDEVVRRFE